MDIETGETGSTLSHEDFVNDMTWSPDGSLLATAAAGTVNGNYSPIVVIWEAASGNALNTLVMEEPAVDIDFSPDGARLAALSSSGVFQIWTAAP
jgi:WD40 repeat protein